MPAIILMYIVYTHLICVLFVVVFAFIHHHSIEMFILFCVCRKAQEQVNHLSPNLLLLFAFLCSFSHVVVVATRGKRVKDKLYTMLVYGRAV